MLVEPLVSLEKCSFSVESALAGTSYSAFRLLTDADSDGEVPRCEISIDSDASLVVIDSVASGVGRTPQSDFYKLVMEPVFNRLSIAHRYYKTDSAASIAEFAKEIDPDKDYTLIFLSGDTSISELLNNIPNTSATTRQRTLNVLTVPLGSANALANSIGCTSPVSTFRGFLNGSLKPQTLPLYEVQFPGGMRTLFFIIFSIGFHANLLHLCTNDPRYSNMGVERFRLASTEILDNYDLDIPLTVETCSGTTITSNNFAYFAIINPPNLEQTYIPSPKSDVLKRQLHILGYTSELTSEELTVDILKGYELRREDSLSGPGIVYEPIEEDFEIVLQPSSEEQPTYKSEVCCDGLLYNLRDLSELSPDSKNIIRVSFLDSNDLAFDVNIFTNQ